MFNKKYKDTIQELEFQKATKEVRIKEQQEEINYLKKCIEELKNKKVEELCKDYKYAILVKNYDDITLWNDGRIEHNIQGISFECDVSNIPELEIRK